MAEVLDNIRTGRWPALRELADRLPDYDLQEVSGKIEQSALSSLESVGDHEVEQRQLAYEFLAELRPDDPDYREKASSYRQRAEARAEALAEQERLTEKHCTGDGNGIDALVVSQLQYIKPKLRSPSTADFPYYTSDGVSVTFLNGCTFVVRTYVDAQNAFGATIRTRFVVKLQRDVNKPDAWRLIDMFTVE